jgi:ribose 5-phosphate isomerase B
MPGVPDRLTFLVGSDHAAVELRTAIAAHLRGMGHVVEVRGPDENGSVDYPDIANPIAREVATGDVDRAVLVCGTGQGMAMTANKVPGVRAALVADEFSARMATLHNDARVLCMGARVIGVGLALSCVDAWLGESFEGGRHARRVGKIEAGVSPGGASPTP